MVSNAFQTDEAPGALDADGPSDHPGGMTDAVHDVGPGGEARARTRRDVDDAIRGSDLGRAIDLACAALAGGDENALYFNLRAMRLQGQGRAREALTDLERAGELAPDDFTVLNAIGLCFAQLDRGGEAMSAFDAALALEPRFAPAHVNRGRLLEARGDLGAARQAFETAIEHDPQHPEALGRLALHAARRSDWAAARDLASRALAIDPAQKSASLALAMADITGGDGGAAEARLKVVLADEAQPPSDRAAALGLLGDALDAQDRAAEAFDAYAESNQVFRRIYESRFTGPKVQTARDTVRWLISYFEKAPALRWAATAQKDAAATSVAAGHVFIVGFPRSGSTLLQQILASHPGVVSLGKRDGLADAAGAFMSTPAGMDQLSFMGEANLEPYRQAYWRRVGHSAADLAGKVLVDELPLNTLKLPLISKLFPGARILFSLRDPRDVVLSCFRRRFRVNAAMYQLLTLEGAAGYYDDMMRLAEIYRDKLPLMLRALRHEDFVSDFEAQARALCDFVGVGWVDAISEFAERARTAPITAPGSGQIAEGLQDSATGRWRAYRDQLEPVLSVLQPWTTTYGYPAD